MKALIFSILTLCLMVSCQSETLQTYIIDSKEDENFISVDFSLKTFVDNFDELSKENQELFKDINKINFLAFKKDKTNEEQYKIKQAKLFDILTTQFKDNQLMSVNSDNTQVKMYADDLEDTVEEIILYANDSEKGFAVVRLLGEDINPTNFYKLMQVSGKMNFDSISDLVNMK